MATDDAARRRRRTGAMMVAAVIAAMVLASRVGHHAPASTPAAEVPAVQGPLTAEALVPEGARGVLRVELAAMRRSAAFGAWFERARGTDACAAELGDRIARVFVLWPGSAMDDFVLVLDGALDHAALRRCAVAQRGRETTVSDRVEHGVPVFAVSQRAGADGGAAARAETWQLPSGVVMLGPVDRLRALLAESLTHPGHARMPPDLAEPWRDIPPGVLIAGVRALGDGTLDPSLARARVVSGSLQADGAAAVLTAVVRCDDAGAATAIANALGNLRRTLPDLTATAEGDRVNLRAPMDAPRLDELRAMLSGG